MMLEGTTPNRKFDFHIKAIASLDDGVTLDGEVKWLVAGRWRPVKHKALADKLATQAEAAAQDQDFSLEIHEGMAMAAEYAAELRSDR